MHETLLSCLGHGKEAAHGGSAHEQEQAAGKKFVYKIYPAKRVIPHREGQCLSEVKEVPKAKPRQFQGFTKALAFPKGYSVTYPSYLYHILVYSDLKVATQKCLTLYLL